MNDHLFRFQHGELLPNSFRWFVGQNLMSFLPWHFCTRLDEFDFASKQFVIEDISSRQVFTVLRRQDKDDFAGFEIVENRIQENIIYFHPAFNGHRNWDIVCGEYKNLFEFIQHIVLKDMQDWSLTDDFENYKNEFK